MAAAVLRVMPETLISGVAIVPTNLATMHPQCPTRLEKIKIYSTNANSYKISTVGLIISSLAHILVRLISNTCSKQFDVNKK